MANEGIDPRERVTVKVDDLLVANGWDTLREVELDDLSNFNRTTVVRWRLHPHRVFRLSLFALYRFLRSLGYTHRQVQDLTLGDVFQLDEYKEIY